jgi:AcrR family transcriptional regulator
MKAEDERRLEIIEAAKSCFFQYGFARTRMEDIARAAAISRPNLYNFYPNKEAIFVAVSDFLLARSLERVRAALGQDGELWERLFQAFDDWTVEHLEVIKTSAHAGELLGAVNSLAKPVRDAYYERFTELLAQVLRRAARNGELDLARAGLSAASVADMMVAASFGFKQSEDMTVAVYRKRMRTLIDMLRHATGVPANG